MAHLRSTLFLIAFVATSVTPQLATAAEPSDSSRLHAAGWAGVGLGIAGIGLGVTGGVLLSQTKETPGFGNDGNGNDSVPGTYVERRHPLSTTVPLIAVGGASFIAGIGLLTWDLTRSKRSGKLSIAPAFGRTFAGFSATGKF